MTNNCRPMPPKRKRPRVYTERDVGRIVAYARNDGAHDALLIAYILQSFGLRSLQCLLFKVLDILNTAVFLGAIISVLNGVIAITKGLKILGTGKRSRVTLSVLELLIPKKYLGSLAAFFLWIGSVQLAAGTLIIFFTAIANNVALYLLMQGICQAEVMELSVNVQTLDTHGLMDDIEDGITVLETIITDNL